MTQPTLLALSGLFEGVDAEPLRDALDGLAGR